MKWIAAAVALTATASVHRDAAAEFQIGKRQGWELSVDGRMNGFLNYSYGDPTPPGVAEWTAGLFEPADPHSGKIAVVRVRSGFVQNVLGFTVTKEVAEGYRLTGRYSLWAGASNERKPVLGQQPSVEAREAFVKIEAPWGSIQAGRDLGLSPRRHLHGFRDCSR